MHSRRLGSGCVTPRSSGIAISTPCILGEGWPGSEAIEEIDRWPPSEKKRILTAMAGELIPQIIIQAAERRGSVDEIGTRWIAHAYQPQPTDIRKLWADHFASVTDYWRHKARHPHGHAGAMVILYEWGQRLIVRA